MNKNLLLIIQSLIYVPFLFNKQLLCREVRGKAPKLYCNKVDCRNCYFTLSSSAEIRYGLKIETTIKQF